MIDNLSKCALLFTQLACIGSFGVNCAGGPCQEGYYGIGCKNECNCTSHQNCNRFIGCISKRLHNRRYNTQYVRYSTTSCGKGIMFLTRPTFSPAELDFLICWSVELHYRWTFLQVVYIYNYFSRVIICPFIKLYFCF